MNPFKTLLALFFTITFFSCSPKRVLDTGRDPAMLRVMSYNIHHGNPPSMPGKIDIDAIAAVIKAQKPDLVALQEVDVNTVRSGRINEASLLAEKLGMNFFFAKAIDHDGGQYGVAILSRYPLSETRIHRLTTREGTNGEPRILATALVNLPGGRELRFGSTHLDAQKIDTNRLIQVGELNTISALEEFPFIIAGDLNAKPGSAAINLFDQSYTRTCSNCEFTIPVIKPTQTIDFVAFSKANPFEIISHQVIPEHIASDHLPIISVLKIK